MASPTSYAAKPRAPPTKAQPRSSQPLFANYPSESTQLAAGVAIFHVASARVVLCYHARDRYWFLPKGRKDAGETIEQAACREGFEESGYRNRLLPIPQKHRQPAPAAVARADGDGQEAAGAWSSEPVWTELLPQRRNTQYFLFWFVAETLPPDDEAAINAAQVGRQPYHVAASPFPRAQTLGERTALEKQGLADTYTPPRHQNTGVDEEEAQYQSHLVPVSEALDLLAGTSSVMVQVVWRGWEAIELRMQVEQDAAGERDSGKD